MDGHPLLPPLLAGVAAVGCAAPLVRAQTAPPAAPPNIVFVLADDLGYGDLGCYGQQLIATPNLDRLAAQGMRFTQFYAGSPVCAPSRNVLLTGQHTGHTLIRGNAKVSLRPEDVTVAEVLKEAGYATGAVGKWGVGEEGSTGTPVKKGFDSFFGYVDQTMAHNYYPTFLVRDETRVPLPNIVPHEGPYGQGVATKKVVYSDDLFETEALGFLEHNRGHPFFLYFASTLPHAN
ncbi:MAG TPA: sulfatase-like hydrolase/transferase, partial [Opitutaceae bacterium]|nr:sulfatase-like hydrolase/transferase [Opitutaceae bacterium]